MSEAQSQGLRQCVFVLAFLSGNDLAVGFNIDLSVRGVVWRQTKAVSKGGRQLRKCAT